MIQKYGNRVDGQVYGSFYVLNETTSVKRTFSNKFKDWLDIEAWMSRNLIFYGNCSIKRSIFEKIKWQFNKVFGEDNISYSDSGDYKYIILHVTDKGKQIALPYVTEV